MLACCLNCTAQVTTIAHLERYDDVCTESDNPNNVFLIEQYSNEDLQLGIWMILWMASQQETPQDLISLLQIYPSAGTLRETTESSFNQTEPNDLFTAENQEDFIAFWDDYLKKNQNKTLKHQNKTLFELVNKNQKIASNSFKLTQSISKYVPQFLKALIKQDWRIVYAKPTGKLLAWNYILALCYREIKREIAVGFLEPLNTAQQRNRNLKEELELMHVTRRRAEVCINPDFYPFLKNQCPVKETPPNLIALSRLIDASTPAEWDSWDPSTWTWNVPNTHVSWWLAMGSYVNEIHKILGLDSINQYLHLHDLLNQLYIAQPAFLALEKTIPFCGLVLNAGNLIDREWRSYSLSDEQTALFALKEQPTVFETAIAIAMIKKMINKELNDQNYQIWVCWRKVARSLTGLAISWYIESRVAQHGPIPRAIAIITLATLNIWIAEDLLFFFDIPDTLHKHDAIKALSDSIESIKTATREEDLDAAEKASIDIVDANPHLAAEFMIRLLLNPRSKAHNQMREILNALGFTEEQIDDLPKAYKRSPQEAATWLMNRILKKY